MVGEIRDSETAQIAVQAALTGHLVFSTLHTNDAASTLTRLIDMHVEPFLISSSIIGVIAQRLVRRVCKNCAEEYKVEEKTLNKLEEILKIVPDSIKAKYPKIDKNLTLLKVGKGCGKCNLTGYKSRVAIVELFTIDKEMEKYIPKYKHLLDDTKNAIIDINVILHQTPGGMLSNLVNQLRQMDALDRLDDVFETLPKVRKQLGQVPLVTPTSQIIGIQTVNNVLFDKEEGEYSQITEQVKDLCFGLYGKTTLPIDKEVQEKALKGYSRGETPISIRPGDMLEPELPKVKKQ